MTLNESSQTTESVDLAQVMASHGFAVEETGGGCTGYVRQADAGSERLEFLIVRENEPKIPESLNDRVTLCVRAIDEHGEYSENRLEATTENLRSAVTLADAYLLQRTNAYRMASDLAYRFSELLREAVTDAEFKEIVRRNDAEQSSAICHTHDFCDASEVMADAFCEMLRREYDLDSEEDTDLWRDAWDLAKRRRFAVHAVHFYNASLTLFGADPKAALERLRSLLAVNGIELSAELWQLYVDGEDVGEGNTEDLTK